ncbi:MAG: class I SAM-dependent methyltransferase [Patescibacteria group bacterium]
MKTRVKIAVNNPIWDVILRSLLLRGLQQKIAVDDRLTVLEVGCGRGGTTKILLDLLPNAFITATDVDDAQIVLAERYLNNSRVEFMVEHGAELSFDDETFDLVTEFNTLHHIPAWRKAIAEAARVLKPGGKFCFAGITAQGLSNPVFRRFVAPKSVITKQEVLREAKNFGLELRHDLSHPLYMRCILQRVLIKPKTKRICL